MSSFTLSVVALDKQLQFSWDDLKTKVPAGKKIKSYSLYVNDLTLDMNDNKTHVQVYYPTFDAENVDISANYTCKLKESDGLVVGRKYKCHLNVILNDSTVMSSNVVQEIVSTTPSLPSVVAYGLDKSIRLEFNNMTIQNFGYTDLTRIIVTYADNGSVQVPIPLLPSDLSNNKYIISNLVNLTQYEVNVQYINKHGYSLDLDLYATPTEIPAAPRYLNVKPEVSGQLKLTWSPPSDAAGNYTVAKYWLYRSLTNTNDNDYSPYMVIDGSLNSYVDISCADGTDYYYKIRAVRTRDNSNFEADISYANPNDISSNDNLITGDISVFVDGPIYYTWCKCFDTKSKVPTVSSTPSDSKLDLSLVVPSVTGLPFSSADSFVVTVNSVTGTNNSPPPVTWTSNTTTKQISGLVNGMDYNITVFYRQVYRTVNYDGFVSSKVVSTPYSVPVITNFKSTPLNFENKPLSTSTNGKLLLSWDNISYDPNGKTTDICGNPISPSRYANSLRYRIYDKNDTVIYNDLSNNSIQIENLPLGEEVKLRVSAYINNTEIGEEVESEISKSLSVDNVPFYYPENGSALILNGGDRLIDASWNASPNANGGFNLRYQLKLYEGDSTSPARTIDNISSVSQLISALTNGVKYRVVLSSYTTYNSIKYFSTDGGYPDVSAKRTPYSQVPNVLGLLSTPVDINGPLSVGDNGKLRLTWDRINYDMVGSSNGQFTDALRYRVLDASKNKLVDDIKNDSDSSVMKVSQDVSGFTLGQEQTLYVEAYFINSEEAKEYNSVSPTQVGPNDSTKPFNLPTNLSLSLTAGDSFIDASWNDANAKGGSNLQYKIVVKDSDNNTVSEMKGLVTKSKRFSLLTNGKLYTVTLSAYTVYNGVEYFSKEVDDAVRTRTPFSQVPDVTNVVSSPVDDSSDKLPLSVVGNGKLRLTWDRINYDMVGTSNGQFTDALRYRILDASKIVLPGHDAIPNGTDTSKVSYEVSGLTLNDEQKTLYVEAYFVNSEENKQYNSVTPTSVGPNETTQPFYYPTNGSQLSLKGGDNFIDASWNAANANGGVDLRYTVVVMDGSKKHLTISYINSTSVTIEGVTPGKTYNVILSAYTSYDGKFYTSTDGGYVDISANCTPFTQVPDVVGLLSTQVDSNGPLSEGDNGKLKLTWNRIDYDMVEGSDGKFTDAIRYRVLDASKNKLVDDIKNDSDSSVTEVSQEVSGYTLGEQQTLYVEAYFLNSEEVQEYKSLAPTQVGPDVTTQPFNYPTNGSNLSLSAEDGVIHASWDAANAKGGFDLRYEVNVYNGEILVDDKLVNTTRDIEVTSVTIDGLSNGVTYTVVLSAYTNYDGSEYKSKDGGYDDVSAKRTPYSQVPDVTALSSTPVNSNGPLSEGDNGKLKLTWARIDYDMVEGSDGKFTDALRYRVLDASKNVLVDDIKNDSDSSVMEVSQEVSGFTLGQEQTLYVEAYFVNSEEVQEHMSVSPTQFGPDVTTKPFNLPTNGSNLLLDAEDRLIKASWSKTANANGGDNLRYKIKVYDKDGILVNEIIDLDVDYVEINQLDNGMKYTVVLSSYTTYEGTDYESLEVNNVSNQRTPFSKPAAPSSILSNPLDEENKVRSTKTEGRLSLVFTPIEYDKVGINDGEFTNKILYRILDKDENPLVGTDYNDLTSDNVVVKELVLGNEYNFRVQAYFTNPESGETIYGYASEFTSYDNVPFSNPDDIYDLKSTPGDANISFSWKAGNGRGLTPKFETKLDSKDSSEMDQSSPKSEPSLVNGKLYTFNVKAYTEYTFFGSTDVLRFYANSVDGVETTGVEVQDIPRKPASPITNPKVYPQKSQFLATFDVPSDLGGAQYSDSDQFYLNGYRYSIFNNTDDKYVNPQKESGDLVSKEAQQIFIPSLEHNKNYSLYVWAETKIDGPSGVTLATIAGQKAEKYFGYFVDNNITDPDVHSLVVIPGDKKLDIVFAYNYPVPSTYEIILYKYVDGVLTDEERLLGPKPESAPVDGIVNETLSNLTNGVKYRVVVAVKTLDASGNSVYDSESAEAIPTDKIPGKVVSLTATNGDNNSTTVQWVEPVNVADMPAGKTIKYQLVDKSKWNTLNAGVLLDAKTDLLPERRDASNNAVYTMMVRAYYVDDLFNRVYGPFSTVQALPLPDPEKVTSIVAVSGDKNVKLSWTNVSSDDNQVFPKTELEILVKEIWPSEGSFTSLTKFAAVNKVITVSEYTHNVSENGRKYEYQFLLKNSKTQLATDVDAENKNTELVPSEDNQSLESLAYNNGNTRPHAKPVVSGLLITPSGNKSQFKMDVSDNGRYVREILVVGIPQDDATSRDQDIVVKQMRYRPDGTHQNYNGENHPDNDGSVSGSDPNNVLSTNSYPITVDFDYKLKSVLYIVENEDGNTVGTHPILGL